MNEEETAVFEDLSRQLSAAYGIPLDEAEATIKAAMSFNDSSGMTAEGVEKIWAKIRKEMSP